MKKILFFLIIAVGFSCALAKSWHFSSIHIKATVNADGSMHINESRSYELHGKFSWADYRLYGLENQDIRHFKLYDDTHDYTESDSEQEGTYFTETAGNQFYCKWYYQASNEIKTFYLDYTVSNVIQKYEDVAELYWKFIGEANPAWVDTVSIAILLPKAASFGDVKAWAHGPLWGNVKFTHDHILLTVNDLQQNHFVESRIIFPPRWVPESHQISGRKEKEILAEEKDFAEKANRARQQAIIDEEKRMENNARAHDIALPLGVAVVVIFIFLFWRYGRGFDVNYDQTLDANIPDDFHPVLLNCIYFNNNVTGSTLSTSLFYLARNKILKIEKDESKPKKWYDSSEPIILTLDREQWRQSKDLQDFENDLLTFLFDTVAAGNDQVTSRQMKKASSKMQKWFRKWQKIIRNHLKANPFLERDSIKGAIINGAISLIVVAIAVFILVTLGNNGLYALIPALLVSLFSLTILRFTPETKLLKKKLQALRRYLKTFGTSAYESSRSFDISDYFLFAIVLGVGKKYTQNILKNVTVEEQALLFPWFIHSGASGPADFASAINSVVSAAATSVSSAAGAGGGMAAGGGGGGGGAAGGAG